MHLIQLGEFECSTDFQAEHSESNRLSSFDISLKAILFDRPYTTLVSTLLFQEAKATANQWKKLVGQ